MKPFGFIALFLLVFYCPVGADITTYTPGKSGVIFPFKTAQLSMTSEKIEIDVFRGYDKIALDVSSPARLFFYVEYHCTYRYLNKGNDTKYYLGFPIEYAREDFCFPGWKVDPLFTDMRIKIDGKDIDYTKNLHGLSEGLEKIDYDEVYGFQVEMKKNQEKTIEAFYTNTVMYDDYGEYSGEIFYILKSARALEGKIGRARITVDFHFPASISIDKSPGPYRTHENPTDPYVSVQWDLESLIPDNDISIKYDLPDYNKSHVDVFNVRSLMKRLEAEKTFAAWCELTYAINRRGRGDYTSQNYSVESIEKKEIAKEDIDKCMLDFYKAELSNTDLSCTETGFIIEDISRNPSRNPDAKATGVLRTRLQKEAEREYLREMDLVRRILSSLKGNPIQSTLISKALVLEKTLPQSSFLHKQGIAQPYSNYYFELLEMKYGKKEIATIRSELDEKLLASYKATLDYLIDRAEENYDNIIDLAITDYAPLDFKDYYTNRIAHYIDVLSTGKDVGKAAKNLQKLCSLLYRYREGNECAQPMISPRLTGLYMPLLSEKRDLLRNAYYSLARYHFHNERFDQSIGFCKLGYAFGITSPLFDFLTDEGGMCFYGIMWYDEKDTNQDISYQGDDWLLRFKSTKNVLRDNEPFWKSLPNPCAPKENDIINIYTPEKLLSLDLEKWITEKRDNAPCYSLAYNTACAYSRLGKGKESLLWLTTALRLNPSLSTQVSSDTNLAYIRENNKMDLDRIVKQYGTVFQ